MRLQAEMLEWACGRRSGTPKFDGTIRALSYRYQTDEGSPFRRLKYNTREKDTYTLALIEEAIGVRTLASIKLADFWR
jgi:hypothetical protein